MFRSLFSLFASLTVGVTTATAAVEPPTDRSLDQRLSDAKNKIETMMTGREMAPPPGSDKVEIARWYNIYLGYPWRNWDNWKNYRKWQKWHNNWYNNWQKWNNWSNWSNNWNNWGNHWNNY